MSRENRTLGRAALVLLLCAAAIGFGASPASAIIVRLSNGHYLSYMALSHRHAKPSASSATAGPRAKASSCTTCDSINHSLDYGGGPVMTSNTNYVIAWIPQGYSGRPFQDLGSDAGLNNSNCSNDACGFMFGVGQFFKDISHDSGGALNSDSVATQYNQGNGLTAAYNSHYGGGGTGPNSVFIDTDPLPGGSGCAVTATSAQGGDASGSGGFCITDAQIQTELNSFLAAHNLPRGLTNQYFLLTPPDVVTCFDTQGTQCSGNAPMNQAKFCGYHSFGGPGNNGFLYSDIVDVSGTTTSTSNDGINGCDPFATDGDCLQVVCNYNANFAEGSLSAVSHEHIESITDPQPPSGWNDDEKNSPHHGGQEIGDLCNNDQPDDGNTNYQFNSSTFTDTPFNYTINGHNYWLQMEYSNLGASCQHALTAAQLQSTPGSAFFVQSQSGNNVLLNAAGSCGNQSVFSACAFNITEFVWQFDDAAGHPPGGLVNSVTCSFPASGSDPAGCSGDQISHRFPGPGTYNVALTTQLGSGRSWGSVLTVHIYAAPHASITVSGSGLAGTRVRFNGSGSTHDPSLSIASYRWSFGDGASATGAIVSHTYVRAGTYPVRLTVTDSKGQVGSSSGHLRITPACHVPNVGGKSLSSARSAITHAGCAVGKVTSPKKKPKHKHLVVSSQSPRAGSVVAAGTRVSLTLVYR